MKVLFRVYERCVLQIKGIFLENVDLYGLILSMLGICGRLLVCLLLFFFLFVFFFFFFFFFVVVF